MCEGDTNLTPIAEDGIDSARVENKCGVHGQVTKIVDKACDSPRDPSGLCPLQDVVLVEDVTPRVGEEHPESNSILLPRDVRITDTERGDRASTMTESDRLCLGDIEKDEALSCPRTEDIYLSLHGSC